MSDDSIKIPPPPPPPPPPSNTKDARKPATGVPSPGDLALNIQNSLKDVNTFKPTTPPPSQTHKTQNIDNSQNGYDQYQTLYEKYLLDQMAENSGNVIQKVSLYQQIREILRPIVLILVIAGFFYVLKMQTNYGKKRFKKIHEQIISGDHALKTLKKLQKNQPKFSKKVKTLAAHSLKLRKSKKPGSLAKATGSEIYSVRKWLEEQQNGGNTIRTHKPRPIPTPTLPLSSWGKLLYCENLAPWSTYKSTHFKKLSGDYYIYTKEPYIYIYTPYYVSREKIFSGIFWQKYFKKFFKYFHYIPKHKNIRIPYHPPYKPSSLYGYFYMQYNRLWGIKNLIFIKGKPLSGYKEIEKKYSIKIKDNVPFIFLNNEAYFWNTKNSISIKQSHLRIFLNEIAKQIQYFKQNGSKITSFNKDSKQAMEYCLSAGKFFSSPPLKNEAIRELDIFNNILSH